MKWQGNGHHNDSLTYSLLFLSWNNSRKELCGHVQMIMKKMKGKDKGEKKFFSDGFLFIYLVLFFKTAWFQIFPYHF